MISVSEAESIILQNVQSFPEVECPLEEAYGRVLKEDVCADRDQPPAHRVAMDGIAISFSSWEKGQRRFRIEGTQKAGVPALRLKDDTSCLEVMTGAVLSDGCDCVIPVEEIRVTDGTAELSDGFTPKLMQNVHPKAIDYKKGKILLKEGEPLTPQHIAVAASVGKATIKVAAGPKIAVVGTGDELVDVDKAVEVYQVRRSNSYAVDAILKKSGFRRVSQFHIPDDKEQLRRTLAEILCKFDVLILSGGVSMGKFDFVPEILKDSGVEPLFHKIKQRPGKPFWFGLARSQTEELTRSQDEGKAKDGKPVFALPGNPVSTQMCVYRYVLPYLRKAAGLSHPLSEYAVLSEPVEAKKDLTYFVPVVVSCNPEGLMEATPIAHTGSGDYASLTQARGFVELSADKKPFKAGCAVKFYRW